MDLSGSEMREAMLMCMLLLARIQDPVKPNIDDWKTRRRFFHDEACGLLLWLAVAYNHVFENVTYK